MNIIQCPLDISNTTPVNDTTLGNLIRRTGKDCLWGERTGAAIDTVVIHFISASEIIPHEPFDIGTILWIFAEYSVSSHYLIDRDGTVRQLAPEGKKAWHCGGSIMPSPDLRQGVNDFSIGIELAATENSGYTAEQYESCAMLCHEIEGRYGIMKYVGHQDVAGPLAVSMGLRQEIKTDPGFLFDWDKFHDTRKSFNRTA